MTGPNPDAELDAALGVTGLPPAAVTEAHHAIAWHCQDVDLLADRLDRTAQAIADAEQRGAARVLAEHRAAGSA